jgi:hypothetical protein
MERTTIRPVRPALGSNNHRTAFNLFRRKREPDLLCAVPQDCPVPGFVEASAWAFVGTHGQGAHDGSVRLQPTRR